MSLLIALAVVGLEGGDIPIDCSPESRGLIERGADVADAEASRFRLTDRGRTMQRRLGNEHSRHTVAAMARSLT